jgi:shikimate kinase
MTLKDLYAERTPLYETYADLTITCDDKPIRKIVQEIVAKTSEM